MLCMSVPRSIGRELTARACLDQKGGRHDSCGSTRPCESPRVQYFDLKLQVRIDKFDFEFIERSYVQGPRC
jgi:hypothetical protein